MRRLLLNIDPYGGTDPLGMFSLFLKRSVDVMPLSLKVVFRRLTRLGSFLACLRQANVTPIPKRPSSSAQRLAPVRLVRFMELSGALQIT